MRFYIFILTLLTTINSFAQKGIFKQGIIVLSEYREDLTYEFKDECIILNVEIEGKTYRFLLDTGAPTTINDKIKGNFPFLKEEEITDAATNTQKVNYVTIPEIKIGSLTFKNFAAIYQYMSLFEKLQIDGIIGANIVNKSAWDFDLANQKITISNQLNTKQITNTFKKVKIKILDTGTPALTLTYYNKIKEKNIYFDTGYNGFFYLSTNKFNELREAKQITKYIEGNGIISQSAFGITEGISYMTPLKMKLGEYNLPPFISDVDEDEESNMGSQWLKYYHTILYKNHLYFKENKQPKIESSFKSLGITTSVINNELLISFVWNNTNASAKGLKPRDKILSVNQKDTTTLTTEELRILKQEIKNLDKVLFEINTKGNFIELTKDTILSI